MRIGKAIKSARKLRGMSQRELSKRAKLSITYISEIENEKKDPSLSALRTIGAALRVEPSLMALLAMDEAELDPEHREGFKALKSLIEKKLLSQ